MRNTAKDRLFYILALFLLIGIGIVIILYNLERSITFFYPPSKLREADISKEIRVGGLIKPASITKGEGEKISFIITDNVAELRINYNGLLPALFREKQGIIARGKIEGNTFRARELLTKHDENYMPPEIGNLIKSGE